MLSRLAIRSALQARSCMVAACRSTAQTSSNIPGIIKEGPERDLVNYPRPVRLIYPSKVRLLFIPDEWFTFFYSKTGVTGPYLFGTGLITFLFSKEWYIIEHEFYTGIGLLLMVVSLVKKFGPQLATFLDDRIDKLEKSWKTDRLVRIENCEESIADEKYTQWSLKGQKLLFEAKKENVALQLEAAYREWLMTAYKEIKHRLDYQVEVVNAKTKIQQKHMINWIVSNVRKSITPQQEKEALKKCIADLKALA